VGDPHVRQALACRENVVEVHQRLAHPHEDGVVHGLLAAEVQRLVEDLGRGQVAAEAHGACGAERARQRAAGLARYAQRAAPVAVAHEHCLDGAAVVGLEERLLGPVGGERLVDRPQRGERHLVRELCAEFARHVRHLVV
jgi:hypothetical protein